MSIACCKDCNNSDRFYEIRRVTYTEITMVNDEGEFIDEIDSDGGSVEVLGYECANCHGTNIEWSED